MTGDVVTARGLYRTFEAELAPVRALRGADLDVSAGEFVAIMGPSGCGKSTLLNLVAGLDRADEGDISVAGESLVGLDDNQLATLRRGHVGIVFQFFNLLETMTVIENVLMPALIAGTKRRPAEARARDLLDLLGIGDKADQAPAALSGGQRQRLAIARALANQPTLLLADEPTGALDSEGGLEILELFRRLHAEGQTILLVTHDQPVADAAQRVVRMRDGRVEDDGHVGSPVAVATGSRRTQRWLQSDSGCTPISAADGSRGSSSGCSPERLPGSLPRVRPGLAGRIRSYRSTTPPRPCSTPASSRTIPSSAPSSAVPSPSSRR